MAELDIPSSLIRIGKDLIGFVYFLELLLSFLISGVKVGVILLGKLSECLFELIVGSTL